MIWYNGSMTKEDRTKVHREIHWRVGGEAGAGVKVTGTIFGMTCSRSGMFLVDYVEYPSLIRGGHNVYSIRASNDKVYSHEDAIDILVALNREAIDQHKDKMNDNGYVVFDPDQVTAEQKEFSAKNVELVAVPLLKLAQEIGTPVMKNMVATGASYALLGCDSGVLIDVVQDMFKKKGKEVVEQNVAAATKGFEFVKKNYKVEEQCFLDFAKHFDPQLVVTGNEAVAAGAIAGGCKFYAAYPMTPSTAILQYMAAHDEQFGIVVKHAEDEISVINMAIGASFTGVRSMVATSGGGFALMNESVSLAGMLETPIVIVEVMRPGPATGLPTWTGQGDLNWVINAGHGEFPRIVIAPGDPEEAFEAGWMAHNLAEQFQIPVIILTDKYLAESRWSTPPFPWKEIKINRGKIATENALKGKSEYLRYESTQDGIAARAFPGTPGGVHLANSDEHAQSGFVSETSEDRNIQNERRRKKLEEIQKHIQLPTVYGPDSADLTMVVWGSQKGPALQARVELELEGIKTNIIHVKYIWPFPGEVMHNLLQSAQRLLLIENNATGQLSRLINEFTHIDIEHKLLKDDGRPVFPSEIKARVKELLG